jgi:hypothetical protein
MKSRITMLMWTFFLLIAGLATGRDKRVTQVPNGTKFSCSTCHTGFGGPRNDFGKEIEGVGGKPDFLDDNGDVEWGSTLANIDSDLDLFSNGVELQDPTGVWKIGDPNPGDVELVTKPGDPTSKPEETGIDPTMIAATPLVFTMDQNYPNPFNPVTFIRFSVPSTAWVSLAIFNARGEIVRQAVNEYLNAGQYSVVWNGKDDTGRSVGSGIYLYRLRAENYSLTRSMLLLK